MIALDKQLHFLGCFALAAAVHLVSGNAWIGAGTAMLIGVAKEVIDSRNPRNYFSWMDLAANTAGIAAFLFCYYLGQYFSLAA